MIIDRYGDTAALLRDRLRAAAVGVPERQVAVAEGSSSTERSACEPEHRQNIRSRSGSLSFGCGTAGDCPRRDRFQLDLAVVPFNKMSCGRATLSPSPRFGLLSWPIDPLVSLSPSHQRRHLRKIEIFGSRWQTKSPSASERRKLRLAKPSSTGSSRSRARQLFAISWSRTARRRTRACCRSSCGRCRRWRRPPRRSARRAELPHCAPRCRQYWLGRSSQRGACVPDR